MTEKTITMTATYTKTFKVPETMSEEDVITTAYDIAADNVSCMDISILDSKLGLLSEPQKNAGIGSTTRRRS